MVPLNLDRDIIVFCRSSQSWGWDVVCVDRDGTCRMSREGLRYGSAYEIFMREAFEMGGVLPDLIVTDSTLVDLQGRQFAHSPVATIFCPQGGPPTLAEFWCAVGPGGASEASEEFHVSNLRKVVTATIEAGSIPNFLDRDRAVNTEFHVHRDWRAADFSEAVQERHAKFLAANTVPETEVQRVADEKEAHIRAWGTSSPHWKERYGSLAPHEWDLIWAGWQRQELDMLRVDETSAVTFTGDPTTGDRFFEEAAPSDRQVA